MIKRITLVLLLCVILISCGKKGSPEYKKSEKEVKIQIFQVNKA